MRHRWNNTHSDRICLQRLSYHHSETGLCVLVTICSHFKVKPLSFTTKAECGYAKGPCAISWHSRDPVLGFPEAGRGERGLVEPRLWSLIMGQCSGYSPACLFQRRRDKSRFSSHWFSAQILQQTEVRSPALNPGLPHGRCGTQLREPSPAASQEAH